MSVTLGQAVQFARVRVIEPYAITSFQSTLAQVVRARLLGADGVTAIDAALAAMVKAQLLETAADIEFREAATMDLVPAMGGPPRHRLRLRLRGRPRLLRSLVRRRAHDGAGRGPRHPGAGRQPPRHRAARSRRARAAERQGGVRMSSLAVMEKTPDDRIDYDVDFTRWLTDGDSVIDAIADVEDPTTVTFSVDASTSPPKSSRSG